MADPIGFAKVWLTSLPLPACEQIAKPFEWNFTRVQLKELVAKLKARPACALAA